MAWEAHSTPEHYCDAWQANPQIIPENLTLPSDDQPYFFLKISAVIERYALDEEDEPSMVEETVENEECFLVPHSHLVQEQTSWSRISHMLSQVHVPIDQQPTMLHRISRLARIIASDPGNLGSKILPMMVKICVCNIEEGTEEEEDEIASHGRLKPALKESVESLESLEIEQSPGLCVICQDEITVGSTAKSMPCQHVYHSDCIVNWLGVSNFCPLCRFELPS